LNSWNWRTKLGGCERHVDVFKENLSGDPSHAVRGLDEVIAGAAGLFAAESVGEDERFGELTRAHQETGAVDGPFAFEIHKYFLSPSAEPGFASGFQVSGFVRARLPLGGWLFQTEPTVPAEKGRVNYKRIVQRWIFRSQIGSDESASRFDRRRLWLARERRGLSGARKVVLDVALPGVRDLHIGCTAFAKQGFKVSGFQGLDVSRILSAGLPIRHVQDKI